MMSQVPLNFITDAWVNLLNKVSKELVEFLDETLGFINDAMLRTPHPTGTDGNPSIFGETTGETWTYLYEAYSTQVQPSAFLLLVVIILLAYFTDIFDPLIGNVFGTRSGKQKLVIAFLGVLLWWPAAVLLLTTTDALAMLLVDGVGGIATPGGDSYSGIDGSIEYLDNEILDNEKSSASTFIFLTVFTIEALLVGFLAVVWQLRVLFIYMGTAIMPLVLVLQSIQLPGFNGIQRMFSKVPKWYAIAVFISLPGAVLVAFSSVLLNIIITAVEATGSTSSILITIAVMSMPILVASGPLVLTRFVRSTSFGALNALANPVGTVAGAAGTASGAAKSAYDFGEGVYEGNNSGTSTGASTNTNTNSRSRRKRARQTANRAKKAASKATTARGAGNAVNYAATKAGSAAKSTGKRARQAYAISGSPRKIANAAGKTARKKTQNIGTAAQRKSKDAANAASKATSWPVNEINKARIMKGQSDKEMIKNYLREKNNLTQEEVENLSNSERMAYDLTGDTETVSNRKEELNLYDIDDEKLTDEVVKVRTSEAGLNVHSNEEFDEMMYQYSLDKVDEEANDSGMYMTKNRNGYNVWQEIGDDKDYTDPSVEDNRRLTWSARKKKQARGQRQ